MNINGRNAIACHDDLTRIGAEGHGERDGNVVAVETLFVVGEIFIEIIFRAHVLLFFFSLLRGFLSLVCQISASHFFVLFFFAFLNHHGDHSHLLARLIIPQSNGTISATSDAQRFLTALVAARALGISSNDCRIHCRNERRMPQQIPVDDVSLRKIRYANFLIPIGCENQLLLLFFHFFFIPSSIGRDYIQPGEHGCGMSQK
mmetsp:Transcript_5596/g.12190  ORF Transcript_5596/g.12190 Transcript_5596/m.12190 type:complete len:203 (-) Transcript_5596:747-1355(-)